MGEHDFFFFSPIFSFFVLLFFFCLCRRCRCCFFVVSFCFFVFLYPEKLPPSSHAPIRHLRGPPRETSSIDYSSILAEYAPVSCRRRYCLVFKQKTPGRSSGGMKGIRPYLTDSFSG